MAGDKEQGKVFINDEQEAADPKEENSQPESAHQDVSDEELMALCQERICPQCPQKQEMDQEILRVKADADNYRKRIAREKDQHCRYAAQGLLEDLVPVIDNLELAVGHGHKVEACKDLVQGVDMTIKIFLDTLKKHGLEAIECTHGESFDPNWHEALAEEEREDLEAGKVCQIMQKGYTYNDRVVRPTKAMVSKNGQKYD